MDVSKFKDQATSCSKQLQLLEISTAKPNLNKIKRSKKKVSSKKKVKARRSAERKKKKNTIKRACGRGTKQAFRCALPPFKWAQINKTT